MMKGLVTLNASVIDMGDCVGFILLSVNGCCSRFHLVVSKVAEYIMHLQRFHYQLMKRNTKELYRILMEANKIRKVLDQPATLETTK